MIRQALISKERQLLAQDRRLHIFVLLVSILVLASLLLSWVRMDAFEREFSSAEQRDREMWVNQGEQNPHAAAHFARYGFKPIPGLSVFDPGIIDYAGIAVWMVAHAKDPAVFRHAEDGNDLTQAVRISPAWVLQYVVPLLIIVAFAASFAGEREDRTLRQLLSSGVSGDDVFWGKFLGSAQVFMLALLPFVLLPMLAVWLLDSGATLQDQGTRILGLALSYGLYLFVFVMLAMGVSALCRSRRQAMLVLFSLWVVLLVALPKLSAGIARVVVPSESAFEINQSLFVAGEGYWMDSEYQEEERHRLLHEHKVDSIEDLPFEYEAYQLQAGEEYGDAKFDEIYSDIEASYARQDALINSFGLLTPAISLSHLSMALSGVDRLHHMAYTRDAEQHRRDIIKLLNEDMIFNAGEAGEAYKADERLWQATPDFEHRIPTFASQISHHWFSILTLLLWALASFAFARWSAQRAVQREAL